MARHGSLADGLLAWRNRPEIDEPIAPVKTNWTVVASNDNANPEEVADFGFERQILITPSVKEIDRNVKAGPTVRNEAGQIVRIGSLRFSDGNQTERAYCYGPEGKLIQYDAPMPVGSMLGTRDKADRQLGGKGHNQSDVRASGRYLADIMQTDYPRYVKATSRRNGKSCSRDESEAVLTAAYANTPVLPPVTYCPPSLPCGTPKPMDAFVGLQKGKKGESGAIAWEDIATSMVNREIWDETLRYLSERDVKTLDAAMEAKNMRSIGETHGFVGKRAERMGKRILSAANDNLRQAMKIAS